MLGTESPKLNSENVAHSVFSCPVFWLILWSNFSSFSRLTGFKNKALKPRDISEQRVTWTNTETAQRSMNTQCHELSVIHVGSFLCKIKRAWCMDPWLNCMRKCTERNNDQLNRIIIHTDLQNRLFILSDTACINSSCMNKCSNWWPDGGNRAELVQKMVQRKHCRREMC